MVLPLLKGFLLGFSLIFAIGAQNVFVFRQGLLRKFVFPVVIFCSLSDTLLIFVGIFGLSFFVIEDITWSTEKSKIIQAFGFLMTGIKNLAP